MQPILVVKQTSVIVTCLSNCSSQDKPQEINCTKMAEYCLCLHFHHKIHFSSGFIGLPLGQFQASENSLELDSVPTTLKRFGL